MAKSTPKAAAAVTAEQAKKLEAFNIKTKDAAKAKIELQKFLAKNDIQDTDDDELDSLLEMANVFIDSNEVADEEEEEAEEEESNDAEETEEETEEEEVPDEEEEEETPQPARKASAKKGALKQPVHVEEEEEEAPAPPKKGSKNTSSPAPTSKQPKGTPKASAAEVAALAKEVATTKPIRKTAPVIPPKPEKKAAKAASTRRKLDGKPWETLTDAEKDKAMKPILKLLDLKKYVVEKLQKSFVVKYNGTATQHSIFKYHLLRLLPDGTLIGFFLSQRCKTPEDLGNFITDDLAGEEPLRQGVSCSYIHHFPQGKLVALLSKTDFLKVSTSRAEEQDTKMKNNVARLKASLEEGEEESSAPVKVPAKKKPNPRPAPVSEPAKKKPIPKGVKVAEIPEEEEEAEKVPVTKTTVKATAKKATPTTKTVPPVAPAKKGSTVVATKTAKKATPAASAKKAVKK